MNALVVVLAICALCGCSRAVPEASIPGVYTYASVQYRQVLKVNRDGTYSNNVYVRGVLAWEKSNVWSYEIFRGRSGVSFKDFYLGPAKPDDRSTYSFFDAEYSLWGQRMFCFDPDDSYKCFVAD